MLADLLQLIGFMAAFVGSLMMAQPYTAAVADKGLLHLLASALVRGGLARDAAEGRLAKEKRIVVLQGLGFVALGFLIETIGLLVAISCRL